MTRDPKRLVIRIVATLVIGGILLYLPQYFEAFQVSRLNRVICFAIAALGLNLLTGFNGQISVGHGAFFGVGAYTSVILVADHGWPHYGTLVVAMILTFALGVLIGLPALRIEGLYLALVTLALATVFPLMVTRWSDLTGGSQGMRVPRRDEFVAPEWSGMANDQWRYYVLLGFAVVSFVLVRNLIRSRAGRAIISIRDNETAAETLGVHSAAYKVSVFGVSAMFAGLAGALSTFNEPFVSAEQYNINLSITLLVAVVVGGAATIFGPAIGAVLVIYLPVWLEELDAPPELSPVIFGGSLILLMIVAPGGILGLARRMTGWVRRRVGGGGQPPPTPETAEALASAT